MSGRYVREVTEIVESVLCIEQQGFQNLFFTKSMSSFRSNSHSRARQTFEGKNAANNNRGALFVGNNSST